MFRTAKLYLAVFLLSFTALTAQTKPPQIQMAILLDTSGSMDGLIEQAKSQLWSIVNELARSEKGGATPYLEVALYEYGKSSLPADEGYLRNIVPLTTDLDKISEELFVLQTNGGDEYCGWVINDAVNTLEWSESNDDLKLIFIAGNEPFTQGNVDYKKVCPSAIADGIIVNTIFCGDYQEGISTNWKDGADLADGKYMNIDHNQEIVHIEAPQDEELIEMGKQLNATYIAYGAGGEAKKERQEAQDVNSMSMAPEAMVQRSVAKAGSQYRNASWDLVDAEEEGAVDLAELDDEMLPEELQGKSEEEIQAYVEQKRKEREELQSRISQLNEERRAYVAEKRKEQAGSTLDEVIIGAVREQAKTKNFTFK